MRGWRVVIGLLGLLALAGSAGAADMPVKAPPPATAYDWTGLYVGGHIGIWPFFFLLSAASVLLRPLQDMLPGFAGGEFHAGAVGLAWLSSSMGIGAAASAFWIAFRGRLDGLTVLVFSGFFGLVLTSIGFVMAHTLWLGSVFMVLAGFSLNTMSTSIQALVQTSLHDHMRGLILVLNTSYFVVTDPDGHFRLGGLPAGRHTLKAWIDSRTTREKPVELKNGQTLHVDFP